MGYAPRGTNPVELIELAREAERLGYGSAWAAEAWGTDAVTVLSWLAAVTSTRPLHRRRGAVVRRRTVAMNLGGVPHAQQATLDIF